MAVRRAIPLWLKIAWTLFLVVLVPVYWRHYGPANFLWFSDLALFIVAAALWLENRLLASMAAVGVLALELLWNVEFLLRLIVGDSPLGMAEYMWDASIPLGVRLLSLFHLPLPVVIVWLLARLGYDRRALAAQTVLAWVILPLSLPFAHQGNNINWVRGFGPQPQDWMPPLAFVGLLMAAAPLVVYVPSHLLLRWLFERRR